MVDVSKTIAPKSDQLNADDLIGKPSLTIEVTDVKGVAGEQPIAIFFKGDNGKPFRPCKSMRRVLVFVWGENGKDYIGKAMTLVRDPEVKFGGIKVGGLRITHMSHMKEAQTFSLTESQKVRKPYTVQPLKAKAAAAEAVADVITDKEPERVFTLKTSKQTGKFPTLDAWKEQAILIIDKLTEPAHCQAFLDLNAEFIKEVAAESAAVAEEVEAYLNEAVKKLTTKA